MSSSSNTSCSVCHRGSAKWLCKCANEALCAGGACLAAHMDKSARAHVLVEIGIGMQVSSDTTAACFQNFDQAVEAAEFLSAEVQWLTSEKRRIEAEIDRQVEVYINQLRTLGEEKKIQLNQLLQEGIKSLNSFKKAESTQLVLEHKQQHRHLEGLESAFQELITDSLIDLSLMGGIERIYQFADKPGRSWGFGGDIDALSINVSKAIILKGIGLSKQKSSSNPVYLNSLQILKGNSSIGEVLYSDTEALIMDSTHPYCVKVMLKSRIQLLPNLTYTLKVLMKGGNGYARSTTLPASQDGLSITTSKTVFVSGERDNGPNTEEGIFFELYYSCKA